MNRQEILQKCNNEEDKLLIAKLFDKIDMVARKNNMETTDFLDMHQQAILKKVLLTIQYNNFIVFGGYKNSERNIIILYPEKLQSLFIEEHYDHNHIMNVIQINLPNELKGKYSHRDYLGAIIKLGVKREKIGDILVNIDGADIIAKQEIVDYLKDNLNTLTRFSKSKIFIKKIEELNETPPKMELINIIIPSMRMDSIVSEIIKMSRSKVNEVINAERVFINGELITKTSKILNESDVITVRGKGRFKIDKILNSTKKGNLVLQIEKYS